MMATHTRGGVEVFRKLEDWYERIRRQEELVVYTQGGSANETSNKFSLFSLSSVLEAITSVVVTEGSIKGSFDSSDKSSTLTLQQLFQELREILTDMVGRSFPKGKFGSTAITKSLEGISGLVDTFLNGAGGVSHIVESIEYFVNIGEIGEIFERYMLYYGLITMNGGRDPDSTKNGMCALENIFEGVMKSLSNFSKQPGEELQKNLGDLREAIRTAIRTMICCEEDSFGGRILHRGEEVVVGTFRSVGTIIDLIGSNAISTRQLFDLLIPQLSSGIAVLEDAYEVFFFEMALRSLTDSLATDDDRATKGGVNRAEEIRQRIFQLLTPEHRDIIHNLMVIAHCVRVLEEAKLKQAIESQRQIIDLVGKMLEGKDGETQGHSLRVTDMMKAMCVQENFKRKLIERADELKIPFEEFLKHVINGAILHDVGKIFIPDSVLLKKGPLTDDEREIMQGHPEKGYNLLCKYPFWEKALFIPLYHHERWDGKGYPNGVRGENIPIEARMFSLIDVWDALSSKRPYKEAQPPHVVIATLFCGIGMQFDPFATVVFLRHLIYEYYDSRIKGGEFSGDYSSTDMLLQKIIEELTPRTIGNFEGTRDSSGSCFSLDTMKNILDYINQQEGQCSTDGEKNTDPEDIQNLADLFRISVML